MNAICKWTIKELRSAMGLGGAWNKIRGWPQGEEKEFGRPEEDSQDIQRDNLFILF